jgi:hypothetical protein
MESKMFRQKRTKKELPEARLEAGHVYVEAGLLHISSFHVECYLFLGL